jgi:hypothetical protein
MKLAEHGEKVETVAKLDEFLEKVGSTQLDTLSIEAVLEHVKTLNLSDRTLTIVKECLEQATSK